MSGGAPDERGWGDRPRRGVDLCLGRAGEPPGCPPSPTPVRGGARVDRRLAGLMGHRGPVPRRTGDVGVRRPAVLVFPAAIAGRRCGGWGEGCGECAAEERWGGPPAREPVARPLPGCTGASGPLRTCRQTTGRGADHRGVAAAAIGPAGVGLPRRPAIPGATAAGHPTRGRQIWVGNVDQASGPLVCTNPFDFATRCG